MLEGGGGARGQKVIHLQDWLSLHGIKHQGLVHLYFNSKFFRNSYQVSHLLDILGPCVHLRIEFCSVAVDTRSNLGVGAIGNDLEHFKYKYHDF